VIYLLPPFPPTESGIDMPSGIQSESQSPPRQAWPADEERPSPDLPLISPEYLEKLGVEPQLIPFIVATTLRAERSPGDLPPLSPAEAETLVEALDKVRLPP
jgi:hypothetical protein